MTEKYDASKDKALYQELSISEGSKVNQSNKIEGGFRDYPVSEISIKRGIVDDLDNLLGIQPDIPKGFFKTTD